MWLTNGITLVCAIIGFLVGWWVIRRERRPSACDGALLCWDEEPVSAWQQGRLAALLITLHASSVILLGIAFLLEMNIHPGQQTLFLVDATLFLPPVASGQFNSSVETIAAAGLQVVWFICGILLAFPFARHFVRPMHLAIMPNGVVKGPYLWEWSYLSHFTADPRSRLIRFYSSRMPDVACMAWRPPDENIYSQAVALLGQHLSPSPSLPLLVWYRRKSVLLALVLFAVTIPFVATGWLIYALGITWSWMFYTFITPLVVLLGLFVFRQLE